MKRYGTPGGQNFPYLCKAADDLEVIVYARDMHMAIDVYDYHVDREPYSVRQMSDNE